MSVETENGAASAARVVATGPEPPLSNTARDANPTARVVATAVTIPRMNRATSPCALNQAQNRFGSDGVAGGTAAGFVPASSVGAAPSSSAVGPTVGNGRASGRCNPGNVAE